MPSDGLIEVPPIKASQLTVRTPTKLPFYLRPSLNKELEGKAHLVKFLNGSILVDSRSVTVDSIDGLRNFFRDINPGYHQSFNDEEMKLTEVLSNSQRSDLKEVGQCSIGKDILVHMGKKLIYKEGHGRRYFNYSLTNVIHFNHREEVPDEQVTSSVLKLAWKLEESHLYLPSTASLGSIARAISVDKAEGAYFPLWLLEEKVLSSFYSSIKGPMFRSFTLGDSQDCTDSDLSLCYPHILEYSISASPHFCSYISSRDYQPEAAYCSCLVWINLDMLELMPLGVRISDLLFEEEVVLPRPRQFIVYPYGSIKQVRVNLPTLWFLVEELQLRLGKDIGIVEGIWVVPEGRKVFPWREWSRLVRGTVKNFPELKFIGQIGSTGGTYLKKTKVGEFEYEGRYEAFSTENPIYLSHLFDMTRVLTLLGASQGKKIKGIAADGWVGQGRSPDEIGPVKIGCVSYGPFPVKNTLLDNYYQFDPIRHDKIVGNEGKFWRNLVESNPKKKKLSYKVKGTISYQESWDKPEIISRPVERVWEWSPSLGDNIPELDVEVIGDTLGSEIHGRAPHTSQVHKRIPLLREMQQGEDKRG